MHDIFSPYPTQAWNDLEKKAIEVTEHVKKDYPLDRLETFVLEGYNYRNFCKVESGDVVFDCGAFTGNTALYFSMCAREVHVYSFEAMPETYRRLCDNIELPNVTKENYAISDKRQKLRFTAEATPGSRVSDCGETIDVQAISIDEYVKEKGIGKVDFIKMDIEGAELDGLRGAAETCRRFQPKLAICIYHKESDWIEIPKQILEYSHNYQFFMKHNSAWFGETVLFAFPSEKHADILDFQSEMEDIRKNWMIFDQIFQGKQKFFQDVKAEKNEVYLRSCFQEIENEVTKGRVTVFYQPQNYTYAYIPLSDDKLLHYELLLSGQEVRFCLHLEGDLKQYGCIFSELENPLKLKFFNDMISPDCYEVSYSVGCAETPKFVAFLLRNLIDLTWSLLSGNNLLSDKVRFEFRHYRV